MGLRIRCEYVLDLHLWQALLSVPFISMISVFGYYYTNIFQDDMQPKQKKSDIYSRVAFFLLFFLPFCGDKSITSEKDQGGYERKGR